MKASVERDGYELHYEVVGKGRRIVWVDPALGSSAMRPLQDAIDCLRQQFEVVTYDRRGRGRNAGAHVVSTEDEVADLRALVDHVGGAEVVLGFSSGGALVLHASSGLRARVVVLLEPAVEAEPDGTGLRQVIGDCLSRGDGAAAVRAFYDATGVPKEVLDGLVASDAWPHVVRSAGTLLADIDLSVVDDDIIESVDRPAHVIVSTGSPDEIVEMGGRVARRLGAPVWREPGGWHGVDASALTQRLVRLVGDGGRV